MQSLFLLRVAAEAVSTEGQMGTSFGLGLHIWTLYIICIEVLIFISFFLNLEHVDQSM